MAMASDSYQIQINDILVSMVWIQIQIRIGILIPEPYYLITGTIFLGTDTNAADP
jgi:hypothetical protein